MAQVDYSFLSKASEEQVARCLDIGVQILLGNQIIPTVLPVSEKVLTTKLCKLLQKLCKMGKKDIAPVLEKLPAKEGFKAAFRQLLFDRQLNNYQILKSHFSQQALPHNQRRIREKQEAQSNHCMRFQYRIQVTLSSHQSKKVFKPLILLIFHMGDGSTRTLYAGIVQFEELRKSAALGLKTMHQIEAKA